MDLLALRKLSNGELEKVKLNIDKIIGERRVPSIQKLLQNVQKNVIDRTDRVMEDSHAAILLVQSPTATAVRRLYILDPTCNGNTCTVTLPYPVDLVYELRFPAPVNNLRLVLGMESIFLDDNVSEYKFQVPIIRFYAQYTEIKITFDKPEINGKFKPVSIIGDLLPSELRTVAPGAHPVALNKDNYIVYAQGSAGVYKLPEHLRVRAAALQN